ncbi:MAG TPA: tryptophan synthase subunit alpha [Actinomycetota bacterium]|nr:tryptophan synthase subunit alpha [Actinomycetota bacterium]
MKRLAVYLMAGPELPSMAEAAVEGGADLVEVGFPFSDPLADGPIIREAAHRALAAGMRTAGCLAAVAATRDRVGVPLVPMTYAALLERYGYERFVGDARAAGASGIIVADLPVDAMPGLRRIQLVAPTTPSDRIALAAERTDGWLYLVMVAGVTGPRRELPDGLRDLAHRARAVTGVPLLAGFGIATPEAAAGVASLTDGVVVGSAAVRAAHRDGPRGLRSFIASLRAAMDRPAAAVGS